MPTHPPSKRLKYTSKLTRAPLRNTSTSTLKKKIRDLSRLLSNEKIQLPATVRAENERALAAFKHDLSQTQRATNEARIAKKYHMVRFFERRKATRRLNKLTRDLSQSSTGDGDGDNQSTKALHHSAQVDLNYTLHYPKGEKYISLFKDPGKGSEVEAKREAIRREIERNMERGMLGDPTTTDMMKDEEKDMEEDEEEEEEAVVVKEVRELKEKVQRMEVKGDKGGVKKKRKRRADYEKEEKERGVEEGDGFFES